MFDIAQEYGIQLEKLLERNRLQLGEEPMEGERVALKGKPKSNTPIRLRTPRPGEPLVGDELFVIGEPTVVPTMPERPAVVVTTPTTTPVPVPSTPPPPAPTPTNPAVEPTKQPSVTPPTGTNPSSPTEIEGSYHTVAKGDTLFNVSRRYGITIASLKAMNGLTSDNIQIGQRLRIR
jgi:membrane-bound lytic murein transglycosylase D